MAVCSFLGHRNVFDADIESRLQAAVEEVIKENESVDFWLYPSETFFNYCLLAVLRAKKQNPHKIRICLVAGESKYEEIMRQASGSVPACMFDKVDLYRTDDIKSNDFTMPYKKLLRHIVQNSTYVIACLYERLYKAENHILSFARKNPKIRILSVASPETERAIMENAVQMNERERCVFQKMNEGCNLKEAGASVGVGPERARQILAHGCRAVQRTLEVRYARECARLGTAKRSCGIFALGGESYVMMKRFKHILDFLAAAYHVKRVYIERRYAHSGFVMVLKEWPSADFHLTAVTDEGIFCGREQDNGDFTTCFCPPCDAVSCVGLAGMDDDPAELHIMADIIERSDFCIFNSSELPQSDGIWQRFCRENQTVFLDAGRPGVRDGTFQKEPTGGKCDE